MIYYLLLILMFVGINDIFIIIIKEEFFNFKRLLGDGLNFGIKLFYKV